MDLKKILEEHLLWLNGKGGRRADLRRADLRRADLRGADLSGADLRRADLSDADLRGADLRDADLSGADLRRADLRRADLRDASLHCAYLSNTFIDQMMWNIYTAFYQLQCPESGSYIGYKKARGLIVELEIPADARRSSATSRKCRASKAKVLSITDINGNPAGGQVKSNYDPNFVYAIGETVEVTDFDDNRWNECSTGIHHFITRAEAVIYE
ncbi:MAG: pentapeptide repeat-containing protein [Flavonifractor plautii]|nr:pentapeptide repeat-containing protein [Flavonifractor plautii]